MSAPSFLLANETNHTLLASLLDFINIMLEHKFTGKFLVYLSQSSGALLTFYRQPIPRLRDLEVQAAL